MLTSKRNKHSEVSGFSFRVKKLVSGTSTTKCLNSSQLGGLSISRERQGDVPNTVLDIQCQTFSGGSKALERVIGWMGGWADGWMDGAPEVRKWVLIAFVPLVSTNKYLPNE